MLPDGATADVEALPGLDGLVLWRRRAGATRPQVPARARLELFGRRPRIVVAGRTVALSRRHAEILATLALAGHGLTAEELTLEVYGEWGKPVTLRAEMSRLRRDLDGVVRAKPYAFAVPVGSDLQDAEQLLGEGRLGDALALGRERVLPGSLAPRVVEARERFEEGLRSAVLASRDPDLMAAWCRTVPGEEDEPAAHALVDLLPADDARISAARAHLARLDRVLPA
jgi:hypothetical protein